MTTDELKERFGKFSIGVLKMSDQLPQCNSAIVISRQISRSASSAGANYSAACRSKSLRDFINKLKIVEEELDETYRWLTSVEELGFVPDDHLRVMKQESIELLSIIVKSLRTARANLEISSKRKRD